jgi:hypothetical protein
MVGVDGMPYLFHDGSFCVQRHDLEHTSEGIQENLNGTLA